MDAMSLTQYLGAALISSVGIGWFIRSAITHVMERDLARYRADLDAKHNLELEAFKKAQEKAFQDQREAHERNLQNLQGEASRGLEQIKAGLLRIERLESEVLKVRGEAYAEIWKLMHSVNLFGPALPITSAQLSANLTDWYFAHGWTLTGEAKQRYFLVQELLNFFEVRSIRFCRPAAEKLFAGNDRTVKLLRALRKEALEIEPLDDEAHYAFGELERYVNAFKARAGAGSPAEVSAESAWLLLQFVMSAFRSQVTRDLGSRKEVPTLAN